MFYRQAIKKITQKEKALPNEKQWKELMKSADACLILLKAASPSTDEQIQQIEPACNSTEFDFLEHSNEIFHSFPAPEMHPPKDIYPTRESSTDQRYEGNDSDRRENPNLKISQEVREVESLENNKSKSAIKEKMTWALEAQLATEPSSALPIEKPLVVTSVQATTQCYYIGVL